MSLLVKFTKESMQSFTVEVDDTTYIAAFNDGKKLKFHLEDTWDVEISDELLMAQPTSTLRALTHFIETHCHNGEFQLDIRIAYEKDELLEVLKRNAYFNDLDIYELIECGSGYTITTGHKLTESRELLLIEEPNTSLMYHKLFPDMNLLRSLENIGYTFRMGLGLKISKQHYATTHRGSKSKDRRKLQSIVILKDGTFYRKIPKAKWVKLVDLTDADSVSFGTRFMKKLLSTHENQLQSKWKKLKDSRANNPR